MFTAEPVQAGFVGGEAANVSPAIGQSIGHAVASMVKGGSPESNTGLGSFPPAGDAALKRSVDGSMAYCQSAVASNSKSTARGC